MFKRTFALTAFLMIVCATTGFAQATYKFEGSVFTGWGFSDGVSAAGGAVQGPTGGLFDRLDPKDGMIWGLSGGFFVTENTEVGFMYSHQSSKLTAGGVAGTDDQDIGDMGLNNYHGYFAYNFGETDKKIRPFIYGGLGATNFGSVNFSTPLRSGTISGNTQFSTTWGAGVKYFFSPRFGARASATWTPTYIKSDATGYWCDPYWGCYLVGDAQYSNQIQLTGGVTFRF